MKTPLILFLIALTIRLAVILFWQFDGLYGQDAYAYFQQAVAITENLPQGQLPPTDFFWPNGYPFLIALFMVFTGQTAWAGQLAALLCGAALAPLAYLLSDALFSNEITVNNKNFTIRKDYGGILAALIIAVAGQPILSSVVIMADMPALFWATLSAWLVVRAVQLEQGGRGASCVLSLSKGEQRRIFFPALLLPRSSALWFLAAGVTLALAIISRWLYLLIVPALGFYVLFSLYQLHRSANLALDVPYFRKASLGLQVANQTNKLWWYPLLAVFSGTIILAPQLWLSLNKPEGLAHSFLLGWSPAHFWQRQFENTEGHFSYLLPMAVFYAQPVGHPAYIFPILGLTSLWAIWQLWQAKQGGPLILLLGWAAPVYIFLAGISFQNFRFGLTLYLPLVILASFGLNDLLSRGTEARREFFSPAPLLRVDEVPRGGCAEPQAPYGLARRRRFGVPEGVRSPKGRLRTGPRPTGGPGQGPLWAHPPALKMIIVLSLLGMLAWAYPMLDNFLTIQNRSKIIAAQVEQTLPSEATLITFGLTLTLQHYTQLNTLELFYLDETSLKTLTESPTPLYLLLDLHGIETQWQGKTPQINYQWLKENTTLSEIGAFPPYVLFQVATAKQ